MKHSCLLLLMTFAIGCVQPDPGFPVPSPPKASTQVEPGPTDPDAPAEFTTTETGLKYRILRKSEGKNPTETSVVKVHYRGTLDNGKIFDSSYGKTGKAATFSLNQVVKGWTEGLQLIGQGGMIELEIPSDLGYGERGFPPDIPPKATIHFIVELLEVN